MGGTLTKPLEQYSSEELAKVVEKHLGPLYWTYAASIRENSVDGPLISNMSAEEFQETLQDLQITKRLHCRVLLKEWKSAVQLATPQAVHMEAAADYKVSPETPDQELACFDDIAEQAFQLYGDSAIFAGVNLIDQGDQLGLAARLIDGDGVVHVERMHMDGGKSQCVAVLLDKDSPDFVDKPVPEKYKALMKDVLPPGCDDPHYVGHIVRSQTGERVGMVCVVAAHPAEGQRELLQQLARTTQEQLELRKSLLQRNQRLREQMVTAAGGDATLPPTLDAVDYSDLENRPSWFPSPEEIALTGKPRRSAMLPIIRENTASSKEELEHLPDGYFDEMRQAGYRDFIPIPKNDRERVAALEALALQKMDPSGPTAKAIENLVQLTGNLLDVPLAEVTFQNHDTHFGIARYMDASEEIRKAWCDEQYVTLNLNDKSEPFLCSLSRNASLCNYVAVAEKTFVVHDIWEDESFGWVADSKGPRFYSGSPIAVNGQVMAALCVIDYRARPDFTRAHEVQQEQLAASVGRELENWSLRREMEQLERERRLLTSERVKISPPEDEAAVVFTDVQGSTALWEADPSAMQQALAIHDDILRKCYSDHHGYEVTTEGDAFHVAFHDSLDAIAFALDAQSSLHNAPWAEKLLQQPDAANKDGCRGLRVRIAIHSGPVSRRSNDVLGRLEYTGETVHVAKSVEHLAHGGQVLVTHDAWRAASYVAETKLGSPQVMDLGEHVLLTGKTVKDGFVSKQLFQLVPSSLAFDYFGRHRRGPTGGSQLVSDTPCSSGIGRRFPPVVSQRRLSASFHDAPALESDVVTMTFVYTSELEKQYDDPSQVLAALAKLIGCLVLQQGQGYQCKNTMIAFADVRSAVTFGLDLVAALGEKRIGETDLSEAVKIGIFEGEFTSMGPHQTTGRADYLGRVVNRAARVAGVAGDGHVCVGTNADEPAPDLGSGLDATFMGQYQLKGVQGDVGIYSYRRKTLI